MTIAQALDDVYYAAYAEQRRRSPHVTPRRWGALFADWARLEVRYQGACQEGTTR